MCRGINQIKFNLIEFLDILNAFSFISYQVPNETETIDILKFKPDRLGHCTCIHPTLQGSSKLFNLLLDSKIPVGKSDKFMKIL